jgi:hypothetical protein
MFIGDVTVEVRDDSFNRIGQILPKDLVGFQAVLRFNNVGSWDITLPAGHDVGEILRLPGSGIIVTGPTGVLLSGPTMSATNSKTSDNPNGEWLISGVDDSVLLGERLAYPDPSESDVTLQAAAYDSRRTLASTAMYGYVSDNIGPSATTERRIVNLDVDTDGGIGSEVVPSARFDILGELLSGIASIDGLGFDIKQNDGVLLFTVYEPEDRTGQIRMDVANSTLSSTEYAYGSHSLSRAIVAGQGQGEERQFIEVTSTESITAETLWGRRIETFIDQRNTSDVDELQQAGIEKLADGGSTLTSVDVIPSSDLTMAYGKDWGLGDKVTVVVDDQEVQAVVTAVSISISDDGIRVGATVGEPTGVDYESKMAKRTTSTTQRVNALERKESATGGGGDIYTHAISALNKGSLSGGVIPAGTVVMFAGSQGDQIDILPAVADGTYPEHYLVGVTSLDIEEDELGDVIQLGFVDQVDTSMFDLGDVLYADETVAGGLSITPGAWQTPIAAVTRVHANTGRILVRAIPTGGSGGSSSIFSGDLAPEDAEENSLWFNTLDSSLYVLYNDGDSTQWVEVSVGGDVVEQSTVDGINSRLSAVESTVDKITKSMFMAYRGAGAVNQGNYIFYEDVQVNLNSNYNPSNGRYTAPANGIYRFTIGTIAGTTAGTYRIHFHKNGVQIADQQLRLYQPGGEYTQGERTIMLQLVQGDYIQAFASAGTVYGSGQYTYFTGELLA